jgi:putative transposase
MKKQHLTLTDTDRKTLTELLAKGTLQARTGKRAMALLCLHAGDALTAVAERLNVHYTTVGVWRDQYHTDGLRFLNDAPRSGRPVTLDGPQRAKITALACSTPPEGHSRWSLRMIMDKAIEATYCETISHQHVANILKKTS